MSTQPEPAQKYGDPVTKAGREFDLLWPGGGIDRLEWRERILRIEAEAPLAPDIRAQATAAARAEVARQVREEVTPLIVGTKYEVLAGQAVLRVVLAILDGTWPLDDAAPRQPEPETGR